MTPEINEQKATFSQRPSRTPLIAAGLSGTFRAACGARAGSGGNRRAVCGSGVARAAPVEHSAIPGSTRAVPVEHSAAAGWTRAAPIEPSAASRQARATLFEHPLRGGLERPLRAICGSKASSSGHFEPAVGNIGRCGVCVQGRSISNDLWLCGALDRPFRASCRKH